MRIPAWLSAATCVALTFSSVAARADDKPISLWSKTGLDATWWSARGNGSTFGFISFFSYEIARSDIALDVDVPVAVAAGGEAKATAGLGNPAIGAHYTLEVSRRLWVNFGFKAHVPLASASDSFHGADDNAAIGSCLDQAPSWAPNYFPMTLPLGMEWNPARPLWIRVLVEPQLYLPISSARAPTLLTPGRTALPDPSLLDVFGRHGVQYVQLNQTEVEVRSAVGLGGGVDVNYLVLATSGTSTAFSGAVDHMQISVEPFVALTRARFFARLGLLMALDKPYGFAFENEGFLGTSTVATGHLTLGARLN